MRNKIAGLPDLVGDTHYAIAEKTKLPRQTIYRLKNNPEQWPSKKVVSSIIEAYGVSVSDIVE